MQPLSLTLKGFRGIRDGLGRDELSLDFERLADDAQLVAIVGGNECEDVEIFRYVTEGSFDSYMWQTLETKARFIAQVMKGDKGLRSLEDVELAALSYAEVKALASGNPLVVEKAGVDAEVAKLSTLFSVWRNQRWDNQREVGNLPMVVEALEKKIGLIELDLAAVVPQSMERIAVEMNGRKFEGADAVGEALRDLVRTEKVGQRRAATSTERVVGRFGGMALNIECPRDDGVPAFYLSGHCRYEAQAYQTGPGLVAGLRRFKGRVHHLSPRIIFRSGQAGRVEMIRD